MKFGAFLVDRMNRSREKFLMVLVVSLNPAIDCEWRMEQVRWEEKNVILEERRWAGGKGANVARWLGFLGTKAELLLPLGGRNGEELAGHLARARVPTIAVPIKQETRVNVIVTTARQGQMRFNPQGPIISPAEWRMIKKRVQAKLPDIEALILSGALPRGLSESAYAELIRLAHKAGVKTALDCDGHALVVGAKAKPSLVKPNLFELDQWWNRRIRSEATLRHAATTMARLTSGLVLVSQGSNGALLVNHEPQSACVAVPPKVRPVNTVGAGDALLAAVVQQMVRGAPASEIVRWGVATGTASTVVPGGQFPSSDQIRKIARGVKCTTGIMRRGREPQ